MYSLNQIEEAILFFKPITEGVSLFDNLTEAACSALHSLTLTDNESVKSEILDKAKVITEAIRNFKVNQS